VACIIYNNREVRKLGWQESSTIVFEKRYSDVVRTAISNIVLYASSRSHVDRQAYYYAVGVVRDLYPILGNANLVAAEVEGYRPLARRIPVSTGDGVIEAGLQGPNRRSLTQRSVREIGDDEAEAILAAAEYHIHSGREDARQLSGLSDQGQQPLTLEYRPFDAVQRARRDMRLRATVLSAYNYRCALTGLSQRDHRNAFEADCCHIHEVSDGGADVPNNAMLIIKSLHWAVDRFLISFEDDFRIIASPLLEQKYRMMLHDDLVARVPDDPALRPSLAAVRRHRSRYRRLNS
jgi:hypothetical protein